MSSDWSKSWTVLDTQDAARLSQQLQKELAPRHKLYGRKLLAVAKNRINPDDTVFQTEDGTYAIVHLTWMPASRHPDGKWPAADFYSSVEEINTSWQ